MTFADYWDLEHSFRVSQWLDILPIINSFRDSWGFGNYSEASQYSYSKRHMMAPKHPLDSPASYSSSQTLRHLQSHHLWILYGIPKLAASVVFSDDAIEARLRGQEFKIIHRREGLGLGVNAEWGQQFLRDLHEPRLVQRMSIRLASRFLFGFRREVDRIGGEKD